MRFAWAIIGGSELAIFLWMWLFLFSRLVTKRFSKDPLQSVKYEMGFEEFRVSICDEILKFASKTGRQETELVEKYKELVAGYINNLTTEWAELNAIADQLHGKKPGDNTGTKITVNKRDLVVRYLPGKYELIYSIGFEPYKELYKYGFVSLKQVKNKLVSDDQSILLSESEALVDLFDFEKYLGRLIKEIETAPTLLDLNLISRANMNEILSIFNVDEINELVGIKDARFTEAYGCTPFKCYDRLKRAHFNQFVKLQLINKGLKKVPSSLIELIQTEKSIRYFEKMDHDVIELMGSEWRLNQLYELGNEKLKLLEILQTNNTELSKIYDSIDWSDFVLN